MRYFLKFLLIFFLISCNQSEPIIINADYYLEAGQMDDVKSKVIRYIGKLPKKGTHSNKFDKQFDDYYKELASNHQLIYYYPDKGSDTVYYLFTRIAPSIYLKKVAIAGKIVFDENNDIKYFDETFRTYKMEEKELLDKSKEIFMQLIHKQSLQNYYFENTNPKEFIEFPDKNTYYDSNKREWISTLENPLEDLKREYQESQESEKNNEN